MFKISLEIELAIIPRHVNANMKVDLKDRLKKNMLLVEKLCNPKASFNPCQVL